MLEHLKRILSNLIDWHKPQTVWDTTANLPTPGSDSSGQYTVDGQDEMTLLHKADQAGELWVYMSRLTGNALKVDTIAYAANEIISKVYSITGELVMVDCVNGAVAQTSRETLVLVRKT